MNVNISYTKKIIGQYNKEKSSIIPLLQDIQATYGYIPEESIKLISEELSIFPVEIYGVLTFYSQFNLSPRGKHIIKVCQGTACHVMGGKDILDYLSKNLEIKEGETTTDGLFSLERVACLGCCGMAPVVAIDDDYYGKKTIEDVEKLLNKYRI